jgi:hypothetical protein
VTFAFYKKLLLGEEGGFQQQYLGKLLEPGETSRNHRLIYATKLALRGRPVPQQIQDVILSSPFESTVFAYNLKMNDVEPEEKYLKVIALQPSKSEQYAKLVVDKGDKVPEVILQSISNDPKTSERFASHLRMSNVSQYHKNVDGKEVSIRRAKAVPIPEIILNGIAGDPEVAYGFLYYIIKYDKKKAPEILIKGLASRPDLAIDLEKHYRNLNLSAPDSLHQIISTSKQLQNAVANKKKRGAKGGTFL